MILLAVLFHNIQFFLFHLLAEVLPEVGNQTAVVVILTQEFQLPYHILRI